MGFGFFKHSGLVGKGDPFKDVHRAEEPHPVVLPFNQTQLCAHDTQLCTYRKNMNNAFKNDLNINYIVALLVHDM